MRKDDGYHWESNQQGRGRARVGETQGFAFERQVRDGNKEREKVTRETLRCLEEKEKKF